MSINRFNYYKTCLSHSYNQFKKSPFIKKVYAKGYEYYDKTAIVIKNLQDSKWYPIVDNGLMNALGAEYCLDFFFTDTFVFKTVKYICTSFIFTISAISDYHKINSVPSLIFAENTLKKSDELIFSVEQLIQAEHKLIAAAGYGDKVADEIIFLSPPDEKSVEKTSSLYSLSKALLKTIVKFLSLTKMAMMLPNSLLGLTFTGVILSYIFYLATLHTFKTYEEDLEKVNYLRSLRKKMDCVKGKIVELELKIGTPEQLKNIAELGKAMTKRTEPLKRHFLLEEKETFFATYNLSFLQKYFKSLFTAAYYTQSFQCFLSLFKAPLPLAVMLPLTIAFYLRSLHREQLSEIFLREIFELNFILSKLELAFAWGRQVLFHEHEYFEEYVKAETNPNVEALPPVTEFDIDQYFLENYEKSVDESQRNLTIPSFKEHDTMRFFSDKGRSSRAPGEVTSNRLTCSL